MLKVRQIYTTVCVSALRAGLCAPEAIIGKAIEQIAQGYLRPVFRGDPRQPVNRR
jgi:hypothetical protein